MTTLQKAVLVLDAMRKVLPYLDRDGDGNSRYLLGDVAHRQYRDFKDDIRLMEQLLNEVAAARS
jgi:hypothetical protein